MHYAITKRKQGRLNLRSPHEGWYIVRLDDIVVVEDLNRGGFPVTLQAVGYVFKVNLLHLIKLVHCCKLVKQLLLRHSKRRAVERQPVTVKDEIKSSTVGTTR